MNKEIEKLQAVLQKDPSNFQARRELSIILANEGFNEEALSNLEYLSNYFPEDAEIWYNLGIQYEKIKNFIDAKFAYKKAIEISPQIDFYYNYGELLVTLEEWDEAILSFQKVIKDDPKDGNSYFNLGLCYLKKEEFNLATDNFQKAVEINPQDIFAHFHLGNIYQNSGLTNFAVRSYEKVLEICPDYSWAYFNLASIAYSNGNLDEAVDYLKKTIYYNKDDIEAYELYTKILVSQGEFEEVISTLQRAIKKNETGDLYYILAQVYKKLGQKMEYLYCLKKSLEHHLTLTFDKNIVKQEFDYGNSEVELGQFVIEEFLDMDDDDDDDDEDDDDEDE